MKVRRIASQWYELTCPRTGFRAGFRCHGRGRWGIYFRRGRDCSFGMVPGEEIVVSSRWDAEGYARCCLVAGRLVDQRHSRWGGLIW